MGAILKNPYCREYSWKGVHFTIERSDEGSVPQFTCRFEKITVLDVDRYEAILEADFLVRTTTGLQICKKPKPLYVLGWSFEESAPDEQFLSDKARYIIDSILELESDHCVYS